MGGHRSTYTLDADQVQNLFRAFRFAETLGLDLQTPATIAWSHTRVKPDDIPRGFVAYKERASKWLGRRDVPWADESNSPKRVSGACRHGALGTNIGVMYTEGESLPQDDVEAVKWLRMATEQGDADAHFNLGVMYRDGGDFHVGRHYRCHRELQ